MTNDYIKDYILNLLDSTFSNDLERLKAIYYGLDDIISSLTLNAETSEDKKALNTLTTCLLSINEIIQGNEDGNNDEDEKKERILYIQNLYSEHLERTEKRGISYGELCFIENLEGGALDELERTLETLEGNETNDDFFAVCGYGKAELLEDYHKEENGNNEDKTN